MKYKSLLFLFFSFFVFILSFSLKAQESYIKLNYGVTSNQLDVTAESGQITDGDGVITTDDDDNGYMLSAGSMIGDNWGIDLMYYNMGNTSFKIDASEIIVIDKVRYEAQSAGTISNEITGYGAGLIVGDSNDSDFLSFGYYLKAGMHAWNKDGSTTLLYNNTSFAERFYNEGIGAYGGVGFGIGIYNQVSLDLAYDIIGISNDGSFSNNSTLLSAGLKVNF